MAKTFGGAWPVGFVNKIGVYIYIGYASDSSGAGFSQVHTPGLNYIAFLASDYAIDVVASDFAGQWLWVGPGAPGSQWLAGASTPTDQGVDGDMYLKTNGAVYIKASGTWTYVCNITGPTGAETGGLYNLGILEAPPTVDPAKFQQWYESTFLAGNDEYTKALLHMDGGNNTTVFTDETGKIWTPGGSAVISTAHSKFNGASAYFPGGNGDWISTPDHADWDFTTSDGTINFWMYPQSSSDYPGVLGQCDYNSDWSMYLYRSEGRIAMGRSGINDFHSNTNVVTWDDWQYVTITREQSTGYIRIYIGLTEVASSTLAVWTNSTNPFKVGWHRSGDGTIYPFKGYIDELRISKGIIRPVAIPTAPYANGIVYNSYEMDPAGTIHSIY